MGKTNELAKLKAKHNKLVKSLKYIRDYNGHFIYNVAGIQVSDALHYTAKSLLKDLEV